LEAGLSHLQQAQVQAQQQEKARQLVKQQQETLQRKKMKEQLGCAGEQTQRRMSRRKTPDGHHHPDEPRLQQRIVQQPHASSPSMASLSTTTIANLEGWLKKRERRYKC